ncbi:ParB/Srx family N-terminal domain-containing protein, partial [Sphingomonas mucosissima]|uniref:ParB/Srx family N-terminal domain-containing protein n=1 Tax=Sphingomonas mucosissima TaxID=370959 RepID=UPI00146A0ABE
MTKTATRKKAADLPAVLEQRLGPISYRPLADIQAYAGNPRKHADKQIVQLMASMRHFGFALPLLVDVHNVLICGHARLEAARRLGLDNAPV